MEKYGYIRVSSKDQNPERQLIAMRDMGITEKNLFLDKESGKTFARSAYRKLMKKLRPGDILVVKSIDRLGRNYEEIKTQWARITRDIGADIQVLDLPLLDTTTRQSDLTGVFIADIVLQILAYVAETERTMIRQRQAEGMRDRSGIYAFTQKQIAYNSNKIEGSTLTREHTASLFETGS